jgi:hypothetical protein
VFFKLDNFTTLSELRLSGLYTVDDRSRDSSVGIATSYGLHNHSPPTSAEVKKMWIYTSTPPYDFMA